MADLTDTIEQAATDGVQTVTVDGRTTTAVPIPDQIAAAEFVEARKAVAGRNRNGGPRSGWGMLRPARPVMPGGPA